jgi:hypothetical protein
MSKPGGAASPAIVHRVASATASILRAGVHALLHGELAELDAQEVGGIAVGVGGVGVGVVALAEVLLDLLLGVAEHDQASRRMPMLSRASSRAVWAW